MFERLQSSFEGTVKKLYLKMLQMDWNPSTPSHKYLGSTRRATKDADVKSTYVRNKRRDADQQLAGAPCASSTQSPQLHCTFNTPKRSKVRAQ
jgi:hypothetical protein